MGKAITEEAKTEFLKMRITKEFREKLDRAKKDIPGYENMQLQQFAVMLIEKGMVYMEEREGGPMPQSLPIKKESTA